MSAGTHGRKGKAASLSISLTPDQREEIERRVAEEGAKQGRPITTSEYLRGLVFEHDDQPRRAA